MNDTLLAHQKNINTCYEQAYNNSNTPLTPKRITTITDLAHNEYQQAQTNPPPLAPQQGLIDRICLYFQSFWEQCIAWTHTLFGIAALENTTHPDPIINAEILADINQTYEKICEKYQEIMHKAYQPPNTTPPPTITPPQTTTNTVPQASRYANSLDHIPAVGFARLGNNCWCNTLLQTVVHVPHFKQIYESVAQHCLDDALLQTDGTNLFNAMQAYETCLNTRQPVSENISQQVRLALAHLGQGIRPGNHQQEDAHEAMQLFIEVYQRTNPSNQNPCFTSITTTRSYVVTDQIPDTDLAKEYLTRVAPENDHAYQPLEQNMYSRTTQPESQLLIDIESQNNPSFEGLLYNHFHKEGSELEWGLYQINGRVRHCQLLEVTSCFNHDPEGFFVILKRFGRTNQGRSFKITAPIEVPEHCVLPEIATASRAKPTYELDLFIVHTGSFRGGHYIAYRKFGNEWIEFNDSNMTYKTPEEIAQLLTQSYIHHYRKSDFSNP